MRHIVCYEGPRGNGRSMIDIGALVSDADELGVVLLGYSANRIGTATDFKRTIVEDRAEISYEIELHPSFEDLIKEETFGVYATDLKYSDSGQLEVVVVGGRIREVSVSLLSPPPKLPSVPKEKSESIRESLIEAYRRGYNDRSQERDFDPGHALDLLELDDD